MADHPGRPTLDDLLADYEGRLLRYAAQLTGEVERARDVVQETFLRYLRAKNLPAEDGLAPWLFAVCRNCALDDRRRRASQSARLARKAAMQTTDASPIAPPDAASDERDLRTLVARLPADQAELIRLKFQEGMTYRQMARITGRSASTVGELLHEALRTIRTQLSIEPSGATENA